MPKDATKISVSKPPSSVILSKALCLLWCYMMKWGTKASWLHLNFLFRMVHRCCTCAVWHTRMSFPQSLRVQWVLQTTHQHTHFILDGFVESQCQPKSRQRRCWWVVKCPRQGGTARTASSSDSHKRPCIFMAATPNPNNKQCRRQVGKSAELFISPLVSIETYSPRRTVFHNKQGGPFTEEDSTYYIVTQNVLPPMFLINCRRKHITITKIRKCHWLITQSLDLKALQGKSVI